MLTFTVADEVEDCVSAEEEYLAYKESKVEPDEEREAGQHQTQVARAQVVADRIKGSKQYTLYMGMAYYVRIYSML